MTGTISDPVTKIILWVTLFLSYSVTCTVHALSTLDSDNITSLRKMETSSKLFL